jgi:hypothetical protein
MGLESPLHSTSLVVSVRESRPGRLLGGVHAVKERLAAAAELQIAVKAIPRSADNAPDE